MALIGLFSKARPEIGGLFFDALLEESSELITDATEYPIETGAIGNDHAVTRPLRLTMTVALSDNPIKAALAHESIPEDWSGAASKMGPLVGAAAGAVLGRLGGGLAAAAGIGGSVATHLAGSGELRSTQMIKAIREMQRAHELITVVASKDSYDDVLITGTRVQVTKENEGGLELVVEMRELEAVANQANRDIIKNANLPEGDTASTQAQTEVNLGEVPVQ